MNQTPISDKFGQALLAWRRRKPDAPLHEVFRRTREMCRWLQAYVSDEQVPLIDRIVQELDACEAIAPIDQIETIGSPDLVRRVRDAARVLEDSLAGVVEIVLKARQDGRPMAETATLDIV